MICNQKVIGSIPIGSPKKIFESENMTKIEYEELCERLEKESDRYRSILLSIKNEMLMAHEVFNQGLAEESDFNLGVQHALSVISDIINSAVGENSIFRCPNFKNVEETPACPFTVIDGGLN